MLLFLELEKKEYKKNRILKKQFLKSEFQKLDFSYTEIGGDFRRNFNSISSFHKFLDNKSEDSPNLSDESEIVNVDDTKVGSYVNFFKNL